MSADRSTQIIYLAMKKGIKTLLFASAVLLILAPVAVLVAFSAWGYESKPDEARFVCDDLIRFGQAQEQLTSAGTPEDSLEILETYLEGGTVGFKEYSGEYGLDAAEMLAAIRKRPAYYASLGDILERVQSLEATTRDAFIRLDELHPRAVFPPVYYFIASARAGGSVGRAGVRIAVEVYGLSDQVDLREFPRGVGGLHRTEDLPHLVVHELVHANQAIASPIGYFRNWDNRARAVKEGSADFIAELASGDHINKKAHAYGLEHEADLWAEYREVLESHDTGDWFWRIPQSAERPPDLGYFLGYRIAKAFYDRSPTKEKAVAHLIRSSDYERILDQSEYNP